MRYAGWREHEYAVDSRDDRPIDPNEEESLPRVASWHPTAAVKRESAPKQPSAPVPEAEPKADE